MATTAPNLTPTRIVEIVTTAITTAINRNDLWWQTRLADRDLAFARKTSQATIDELARRGWLAPGNPKPVADVASDGDGGITIAIARAVGDKRAIDAKVRAR
jgi:hypothetical protein